MLKFLCAGLVAGVFATAANAAERQPSVTVYYDHQGTNADSKPNTQRYIAAQTGADVRSTYEAQAPTFGWQPSSRNLADKHPTVRQ
jgi:hypothetical protein